MKTRSPFFRTNHLAGLALAIVAALAISIVAQAAIGDLDPTFGAGGKVTTFVGTSNSFANAVAVQLDGKIVVAGIPLLTRYNSDGTLDTTFGTNGIVTNSGINQGKGVVIQTDGKILVAGNPNVGRLNSDFWVARLNSNGSLDTSFGTNGIASYSLNSSSNLGPGNVRSIALQSDGKIIVAGEVASCCNTWSWYQAVRYNSDGSLDRGDVDTSGNGNDMAALVIQPDGKILLAGNTYNGGFTPGYRMALMRLNPDFSYDSTFGGNGTLVTDFGNVGFYDYSIALQSDGKIVAVGQLGCIQYCQVPPGYKFALARFNTNGSLDTTFGTNGVVTNNFSLMADLTNNPGSELLKNIVVQPDGKLIVGLDTFDGSHYHFLLARFNSNGSPDTSFGNAGQITTAFSTSDDHLHAIVLQPDSKIIAAGSTSNGTNTGIALARYLVANVKSVTATFISEAANDGTTLESYQNSGVGGTQNGFATTISLGDDPGNRQYRSILSFHTESIPDNAVITAAQLMIRYQGVVGTDPFPTFGNLLVDIHSGYFGNSIGLELIDFSAPGSPSTYQEHLSAMSYNWYGTNLSTASNLELINKVGWTQFRLRFALPTNKNKTSDYDKFYSGDGPTGSQPQLIVTYYVP
jgi:uncharacterized delta-60 repeat protein